MDIWGFFGAVLGGALLQGALLWLLRSWITVQLDKALILYQGQLTHQNAKSLEEMRDSLGRASAEHGVRFSKMHERRAEVVGGLYERLSMTIVHVENFLHSTTIGSPGEASELYGAAWNAQLDLFLFIQKHKIWLPTDLAMQFENLSGQLKTALIEPGVFINSPMPDSPKRTLKAMDAVDNAWKGMKEQIRPAKEALEVELRRLMEIATE